MREIETQSRDYRPTPTCADCVLLGEMCMGCGLLVYGMPEDRGREGDCAACPHPGSAHLEFSGLCTADDCPCIEHEPKEAA